ncbi:hypothetical protein [Psychrobacillus sp. OK032]|uniref:hypothetical protein n=1 Tax=Psychrobacillus sp. OK032 TaxID=1884358 RepID=UPI0008D2FD5D|nr:hypothetical protein [Psychrobacillus sp. OK032]SER88614.1 hypothetical protein SAMN05518872_102499 [Psychrobacillus sp. OK032]
MTRLTTEEIEAIRKRAEEGKRINVESTLIDEYHLVWERRINDVGVQFLSHAVEDIPKLLAEVERLRERNKALNTNRNEWMTSHFEFQRKSDKFRKALETIANSDGWLIDPAPLRTTEEAYDKCVDIATEAIK